MKNKHRISALEREVKLLMGTVEQLREQQRSNSSAVRSAIVSIADIQREQSSNATVLRDLIAKVRQHEIDHSEVKAQPAEQLTAEQRAVRDYLTKITTSINELRAEMQKGDRNLGEIVTNNRNHAILDKRHAEQQLAAVQVQLAGLKEWTNATDTIESDQNERLQALERAEPINFTRRLCADLRAQMSDQEIELIEKHLKPLSAQIEPLKEWAKLTERHNEKLNHLELEQSSLSYRLSNMRCAVSLGMDDDLRERLAELDLQVNTSTVWVRLERVEKLLDTPHITPGKQLYQINEDTGQYIAVEPPVWFGELPALLQSLRSEIDALLSEQSSTIAAEIARVSGRVSQTREYVEQLHDRVDTVSKSAHTHHPG